MATPGPVLSRPASDFRHVFGEGLGATFTVDLPAKMANEGAGQSDDTD